MRFHHSTRRGRHSSRHSSQQPGAGGCMSPLAAKLNYDRETNIHFHRRLPIEPPPLAKSASSSSLNLEGSLLGLSLEGDNQTPAAEPEQANEEQLDMELARERLLAQVEKHPLWSSKAARRMQLTGAERRRIYLYELVSFCERRELEWRYEPYRGARVGSQLPVCALPERPRLGGARDQPTRPKSAGASLQPSDGETQETGSQSGARELPSAEQVWAVEPPGAGAKREPFVGYKLSAELARSSFVKRCHGCQGRGRLKCGSCFGVGYEVCFSCTGRGTTRHLAGAAPSRWRPSESPPADQPKGGLFAAPDCPLATRRDEPGGVVAANGNGNGNSNWLAGDACGFCHGAGQKRCWSCAGRGHQPCPGCLGARQLRCYLALNFAWLNHRDELVVNNNDNLMARDRLRLAPGLSLVEQSGARLRPLRPEGAGVAAEDAGQVRAASRRLLDRHGQLEARERVLRQRHRLLRLDCHVVHYEWRQRRGHFVLYDQQRRVYVAKYPFRSFCSIT